MNQTPEFTLTGALIEIVNRRKQTGDYGSYARTMKISLRRLMQLIKLAKGAKRIKVNASTEAAIFKFVKSKPKDGA